MGVGTEPRQVDLASDFTCSCRNCTASQFTVGTILELCVVHLVSYVACEGPAAIHVLVTFIWVGCVILWFAERCVDTVTLTV